MYIRRHKEPHVIFSCGHEEPGGVFFCDTKTRQRWILMMGWKKYLVAAVVETGENKKVFEQATGGKGNRNPSPGKEKKEGRIKKSSCWCCCFILIPWCIIACTLDNIIHGRLLPRYYPGDDDGSRGRRSSNSAKDYQSRFLFCNIVVAKGKDTLILFSFTM